MNDSLSAESWQLVQSIFEQALECNPEQLQSLLDAQCGDNQLIKQAVLQLLEHDRQLTKFATRQATSNLLDIISQQELTTEIGRYRLIKKLEQGGMGQIFLAERSDNEFDKQVVIKLMRAELFTSDLTRDKFRHERQILANLEHPNIARLLDGGTLNNGTPYVVMEYIQGIPITEYCHNNRLTLRQLLKLFLKLCDALEYAHRKLVIHRDIKPANILVTADGQPKLLDFGIAQENQHEAENSDRENSPGSLHSGTLGYASPEQLRNQPQYASTDIYSLGVLLYQLIGQKLPFDGRSNAELLKQMQTTPACQPTSGNVLKGWRSLGPELNLIIQHALQYQPSDRYQSCTELSNDLNRLLNLQPISVHSASRAYRTDKFIRRNPLGVGLGSTILLMLCIFLLNNANHTRRLEIERDKAEQAKDFLVELFVVSDPSESRGNTVTAREILDRGAQEIESELQDQPELQTDLMLTMGKVYRSLGLFDQSESMLQQSVDINKAQFDDSNPLLAEALMQLAWLYKERSEFSKAEALSRESLALRRQYHPDDLIALAAGLNNLGTILEDFGKQDEAEPLYREALAIRQAALPEIHADIAVSLNNLAGLVRANKQFAEAEVLYEQSLKIRRELYGDEHPAIAIILNNLAALLGETGKTEASIVYYRESLAMRQRLYEPGHPSIAIGMLRLASSLSSISQYSEAESLLNQALAIYQQLYDDDNFNVLRAMSNLGVLTTKSGNYDTSVAAFKKVIEGFHKIYSGDHANIVTIMNNLAIAQMLSGQLTAAEETLRHSREMEHRLNGDTSAKMAEILVTTATVEIRQGNYQPAEQLAREALDIYTPILDEGHWRIAMTNSVIASALTGQQKFEQAESILLQSYPVVMQEKGKDVYLANQVVERMIQLYSAWDKPERVEFYTAQLGTPH